MGYRCRQFRFQSFNHNYLRFYRFFGDSAIGDDIIPSLTGALFAKNDTLEVIHLGHVAFTAAGWIELSVASQGTLPHLKELHIGGQNHTTAVIINGIHTKSSLKKFRPLLAHNTNVGWRAISSPTEQHHQPGRTLTQMSILG